MRYLISFIAAVGVTAGGAARAADHTSDSLDTVRKSVADGKAVLVDVREPAEWKAGHIEGAVLVPLSRLQKKAERAKVAEELGKQFSKDKVVYCHCRSGGRALLASEVLGRLGYDVRPLKPGYEDLLKAGFTKAPPETDRPN